MSIDIESLNIEKVDALVETSERFKLRYCDGEIGWAADIGDGLAIVMNVPAMTSVIGIRDVVRVVEHEIDGFPTAGETVWNAFDATTFVKYPDKDEKTSKEWYRLFSSRARSFGMRAEGMVPGLAAVCHGSGYVPREAFAHLDLAHLDLNEVKFITCLRRTPEGVTTLGRAGLAELPIYSQGLSVDMRHTGFFDCVELGLRTEDEVLALVRKMPVPENYQDEMVCPPAIGFSEMGVCGNIARTEENYVILPGGVDGPEKDSDKSRKASLEEVEAWIHAKFEGVAKTCRSK